MALNKATLKDAIKAAFKSVENIEGAAAQQEKLSQELADAIHAYVTSGRVKDVRVDIETGDQENSAALE
jgi:hypothetical protein